MFKTWQNHRFVDYGIFTVNAQEDGSQAELAELALKLVPELVGENVELVALVDLKT